MVKIESIVREISCWFSGNVPEEFDVHWSVYRKRVFNYNQQDASLHSLSFISVKRSTCFWRFLHPSSGAQNCLCGIEYFVKPLLLPATVVKDMEFPSHIQFWAPVDGWRNRPKHVERFTEINKLCNVASCWLYLKTGTWGNFCSSACVCGRVWGWVSSLWQVRSLEHDLYIWFRVPT
jgi:hypothetical protein